MGSNPSSGTNFMKMEDFLKALADAKPYPAFVSTAEYNKWWQELQKKCDWDSQPKPITTFRVR